MRFYTLSPIGVPENQVLFPMMRATFIENGHLFVDRIEDSDVVLFDLHARQYDYNEHDTDYLLRSELPIAIFDEWDRGNMSNDQWPHPLTEQQRDIFVRSEFSKIKTIHFCRLLDKTKKYQSNVFPYEKPILYEEPVLSPDELFNRELDICFIANHSPSRERIANALREDGRLKCNFRIGMHKIPFDDFLNEHRRAKLFINSSAGGYTCERPQCLFSVAGMIRQRTNQLLLRPFTNLENCVEIDSPPTKRDLDAIYGIVNNKDKLYGIYLNGYNFTKTYYTKEYIAQNILENILKYL